MGIYERSFKRAGSSDDAGITMDRTRLKTGGRVIAAISAAVWRKRKAVPMVQSCEPGLACGRADRRRRSTAARVCGCHPALFKVSGTLCRYRKLSMPESKRGLPAFGDFDTRLDSAVRLPGSH